MKPKVFQECLDLYGADLERWPADRRSEAQAALHESEDLRRLLEQERRFEAQLAQDLPATPPGLAQRILAAAAVTRQEPGPREAQAAPLARFREFLRPKPALILAGLLALGFLLGAFEAERGRTAAATDLASLYNHGEASWTSDLNPSY
ncbi:DUF3379 domain-containing protein [Deltaproteobacteria bacterium PRO3]|nr:DUF3379 domain-containing protein [Deltaproteobacteria bacterium PRO3]